MHRPHSFLARLTLGLALTAQIASARADGAGPAPGTHLAPNLAGNLARNLARNLSGDPAGDPAGGPAPSLTVSAPLRDARARLHFEGGAPFGTAWLTLDEGWRAPFARPVGRPLGCYALDARGAFSIPLGRDALLGGGSVSVFAVPPDGDWGAALRPRSLQLPVVSGGAAAMLSQQTGQLVLTEFMKDPVLVSDGSGEWIEFYNASGVALDIEGWVLSDEGSDRVVLSNGGLGMFVVPGSYVVLGREADPNLNGGVNVDFVYSGMTLSNGVDEIILTRPDGFVVDRVRYDDGVVWPDVPGHAVFLAPLALNEHRNDGGQRWCDSLIPLAPGSSDTGTPGVVNETRPGC